jgi:hypothetical protein
MGSNPIGDAITTPSLPTSSKQDLLLKHFLRLNNSIKTSIKNISAIAIPNYGTGV